MAEIIATLDDEMSFMVVTTQQNFTTAETNTSQPVAVESLDNVADVDTSTYGKLEGSVLVYRTNTNKWTSTTTLDAQNMEGGEF